MAKNKYYQNKNGYLTIEELVQMKHNNTFDNYLRYGNTTTHKCPPEELIINKSFNCFYCVDCKRECFDQIKEYQKYYKIKRHKFMKEDLDEN